MAETDLRRPVATLMTDAERAEIDQAADLAQRSRSDFIRLAALKEARTGK